MLLCPVSATQCFVSRFSFHDSFNGFRLMIFADYEDKTEENRDILLPRTLPSSLQNADSLWLS